MRSAVLLVFAISCTPAPAPPAHHALADTADDPTCPLLVAGTSISAEDADGGEALVFVTTGDVAAVRKRVASLASAHNARKVDGDHLAASCNGCMADTVELPSQAAASDVPNGAKVTFTATKADAAADLQAALRMHAGHLAHGHSCKMMMM